MYLVVFDMDGTLVDSQRMIVACMERAFAAHGLPAPTREETLSIVGLSLGQAVGTLLKHHPDAPVMQIAEAYKEAFQDLRKSADRDEPLYPGALDALDALAARGDVVLGIATGKSRRGVASVLEHHDLGGRFATVQTADDHPSKPHPGMVFAAMDETGATPARTVVIGDTVYDIAMGRAAEVRTVGVAWGYHSIPDLERAGADRLVGAYPHLLPTLADLFGWDA